ncbi:hypothetical protein EV127DRAFT_412327 [Xylaria flabelliformis]|nr:hypothetical protein EV127DRAFT_412327 [Xylaria flabelliformis]
MVKGIRENIEVIELSGDDTRLPNTYHYHKPARIEVKDEYRAAHPFQGSREVNFIDKFKETISSGSADFGTCNAILPFDVSKSRVENIIGKKAAPLEVLSISSRGKGDIPI